MASSSVETNEFSSAVENKNVTATTGNLMMQSSSSIDEVDVQKSRKKLSSSSESTSSPDSPLDDPFGEDKDTFKKSAQSVTSLPEHDNDAQIDHRNFEKPVAETSLPNYESPTGELPVSLPSTIDICHKPSSSDNMLATESPPEQVMERSSNSKYRIPSHVFSRSKSNAPVEWSVASNDSLFSIHMGNMSFTKDQFLLRLDDLGAPGESSPSCHQMFNYSGPLPPDCKVADGKSKELGIGGGAVETTKEVRRLSGSQDQIQEKSVAEDHISHHSEKNGSEAVDHKSNDAETMKKVLSLKESQCQVHEKSIADGHISRMSAESSNSTKSFAFPILEGADKGTSISIATSPKLGTRQMQTHSQTVTTPKKQQQEDEQSELNSPEAAQPEAGTSWFSHFSCSSCCR